MRSNMGVRTLFAALTSVMVLAAANTTPVVSANLADDTCVDDGKVSYICNALNVEDLIQIEGTHWVLAGKLPERGQTQGGFYLVDTRDGSFSDMALDFSGAVDDRYKACPGAPDPARFLAHGINIRFGTGAQHELYVVNHGERESIEVFDLDVSGGRPTLSWNGCVIAPEEASLNSVAYLPSGGFATTSITTRTDPESFNKLLAGQPSGFVLEWIPDTGWSRLPASEFSGNNGIEVSRDGKYLYVAGWGDRTLRIIKRGTDEVKTIDLGDLQPDNIRYAADGELLIAGQVVDSKKAIFDCIRSPATICSFDYKVMKFNPDTHVVKTVVNEPATDRFGSATTGTQIGNEIWVGTFRGTRIARVPMMK